MRFLSEAHVYQVWQVAPGVKWPLEIYIRNMVDVVDQKTRSRMMAGIKASNTKPEILLRKALHSRGALLRNSRLRGDSPLAH
ncbi:very short patch repair endonuclease [Puniceibacterium confluentis]|uniref:very short patch repair endonuclease n=1 Tax=Puniceibacterium confluentis TaxID=1958944 RepID=UPI001FE97B08|nr:very short patch repair endonuclease [Puniceibacterium confluentis]